MKKFFLFLNSLERFVILYTTLVVMGLLCVAVFLRYALKTDLYAIDEPEIAIAMWMYFISSAHASNRGSQITADILGFMVGSRFGKAFIKLITNIASAAITAVFAYWSIGMLRFSIAQSQRTLVWRIPKSTYNLAILLGLALMSLYSLRDAILAAKELSRGYGGGTQEEEAGN
jgi:TRAP-type C4-dicarboxylate transport system permease small subunit